jgi:hypothetical protein
MTDLFADSGRPGFALQSRAKLEAEILVLRQRINVLRRRAETTAPQQTDRFLFVWLYRWFPSVLGTIAIGRPETRDAHAFGGFLRR